MEDQAVLEGARIEDVGRHFDNWIEGQEDDGSRTSPRLQYCIMLDKESITNLLTLPERPDDVQPPDTDYVWVKVITSEVRDGRRLWLRVGVYDALWEHWFVVTDPEVDFEEMIAEYDDKEGVANLYGPPCDSRRAVFANPLEPLPPLMDTAPGHPPRELAYFPYIRMEPRN